MRARRESPVVVVGAGPAGLTAAVAMARLGVEVLLVERRRELSSLPRATSVSTRSMEIFRSWGLEREIRAGEVDVEWQLWFAARRWPTPRRAMASWPASRPPSRAR